MQEAGTQPSAPSQSPLPLTPTVEVHSDTHSTSPRRVLCLENNSISLLPYDIEDCRRLQVLTLANNLLTNVPPTIGSLVRLRVLTLSGNQIMGLPDEICFLKSLESLELARNNLMQLPGSIGLLTELVELDISSVSGPPRPSLDFSSGNRKRICWEQIWRKSRPTPGRNDEAVPSGTPVPSSRNAYSKLPGLSIAPLSLHSRKQSQRTAPTLRGHCNTAPTLQGHCNTAPTPQEHSH